MFLNSEHIAEMNLVGLTLPQTVFLCSDQNVSAWDFQLSYLELAGLLHFAWRKSYLFFPYLYSSTVHQNSGV